MTWYKIITAETFGSDRPEILEEGEIPMLGESPLFMSFDWGCLTPKSSNLYLLTLFPLAIFRPFEIVVNNALHL